MLGVITVGEALSIAREAGLDLVEVSPNADPPVCKIIDFGKYKYEMQKKASEVKKKQQIIETKQINFSVNIGDGDYQVKMRRIKEFILEGNKVKAALKFKGREIVHQDIGKALFDKIAADAVEYAKPESDAKLEGKQMMMMLIPLK